jgi:hypothetical protein
VRRSGSAFKLTQPKADPRSFSFREAGELSLKIMFKPPLGHTPRVEPRGNLVERFLLPLSLVQPQNRTHGKTWMLGQMKSQCLSVMRAQLVTRAKSPLPGRPQVLCVRFSTTEPDKYNDGFKVAVDRLKDFGLIEDDSPRCIDLQMWWEKAPRGQGFGLIELWTGGAA